MKILNLSLVIFFFCTEFHDHSNNNINPIVNLNNSDKNLNISLKTIFRDCFEFKRLNMKHPYNKVCNKYLEYEYNKFIKDFKINFNVEKVIVNPSNSRNGLLTGYYEPQIKAYSYRKNGTYPIYKHPNTISKKLEYRVSRKVINNGYFHGRNLEIAWVDNEIEAFFLHIQGSGRLLLENNRSIKVRYAGSNEKKYSSLGNILIRHGFFRKGELDMYKIKNWLYENKKLATKFMNMNERYIYFEEYDGEIRGSAGIELVPNISIAVDKNFINKGEAIIIQNVKNEKDIFLGVAHDEGAAIKGNSRIDLFTGFGYKSEKKAAVLNKRIQVWKLIPKKK